MNKVFLILTALILSALASCEQNEPDVLITSNLKNLEVVNIIDGKIVARQTSMSEYNDSTAALYFSSEEDLQRTLKELCNKSTQERINFADSIGFLSLEKLLWIGDKELDSIGNTACNESDFRLKYSAYKQKYNKIFVFNKQHSDDLSAYIPASQDGDIYASIIGINHKIVVGNSIRNIDFSNDLRKSDKFTYITHTDNSDIITRAEDIPVNSFIIVSGSRKTIFSGFIRYENMGASGSPKLYKLYYHFGAQKKMWYGWKRDSDRNFAITSKNNTNRFIGNAGGNIDVYSNYYALNSTDVFSELAYVWTDITLKDANGVYTYDKNKAYKCQINLSYN